MSIEQFRRTIDVNLVGTFLFVKYFLRKIHSSTEPPAIVLVGSTAGRFGEALHADCRDSVNMSESRCGK
jgi:NAD(P)-dependent dehydrogenase (short-subunit alcohol dehydrogenase family)